MENFYSQISSVSAQNKIAEFEIAKNYFSDILNSQLVIFSLIVTIVVAGLLSLYFFFNKKVSKEDIRVEVEKSIKEIKNEIIQESKNQNNLISNNLTSELERHENDNGLKR